jgi:hypothetical protein
MTPERRAEVEAMLKDNPSIGYETTEGYWPRLSDTIATPIIRELLAEIDLMQAAMVYYDPDKTGVVAFVEVLRSERTQHDPTQPEDDEQHEPVQQAVPPPGMR